MDPFPVPESDLPAGMIVALVVFAMFFVAVLVVMTLSLVRSRRVLKDAGLDPLSAQAQLAAKFAQGPMMTQHKTMEQRLLELDDLRSRGVISEDEHRTARASVLAEG